MSKDIVGIKKAVNAYFIGVKNRKLDKFIESWHPDARMTYVRDGEISIVPRSFWEDYCQQIDDPEEKVTCKIESIDITGRTAVVKSLTKRERPNGITKYTDYLTLLKVSEHKWVIINKSFHADVFLNE